jgi:hypothetical protein
MLFFNLICPLKGDMGQEEQEIHGVSSLTGAHDTTDSHASLSRRSDDNWKKNKNNKRE